MPAPDTPYVRVHDGVRKESVGHALDATMLCGRPNAWPTSCVTTWRIVSPISSSGVLSVRAAGLDAPVSISRRFRYDRMWLWYQVMSLSMISPLRGSDVLGPTAFRTVLAAQRTTEYRLSSGSHSGSSSGLGASFAMIAFLKPAFSNVRCQSSTPCRMYFRHRVG